MNHPLLPVDLLTNMTDGGPPPGSQVQRNENYQLKMSASTNQLILREEISGSAYDLDLIQIKEEDKTILSKDFLVRKYFNEKSRRMNTVIVCQFSSCKMIFKKWHNFMDHMRKHKND